MPAVQLFLHEWLVATLTAAEADAVASLHRLNGESVCAFARSDGSWCDEHLSDDFVCTLADGRRVDKARFLELSAANRTLEHVTCDDVDVRLLGRLALVHGVAHSGFGDSQASTRFTHVWLVRDDRWQLVAAQLTRVSPNASSRIA